MPIVRVNMFEGRDLDQKRALVEGITAVVSNVCGVAPEGVHVLIEEMTRENWGRGGILNVDRQRNATAMLGLGEGFFSVSDVHTIPGGAEAYLAYRREHVNPTMAQMAGFRATILARDLADPEHFLLFNRWNRELDWRAYQETAAHDTLKDTVRGTLTASMEIDRCELVDLPNGGGLEREPSRALYMTASVHSVRPENVARYLELRRTAVNPGMAALGGFCSTSILRRLDAPNEFRIINQWVSREAAEAYHHSTLHDEFRTEVRSLLANHSGAREYETVAL
jgi:4-oxalocrotonate tautomerase